MVEAVVIAAAVFLVFGGFAFLVYRKAVVAFLVAAVLGGLALMVGLQVIPLLKDAEARRSTDSATVQTFDTDEIDAY